MRYLTLLLFLTVASFSSANAQYTLSVEAGYSDYITEQPTFLIQEEVLNGSINFNPKISLRISLDRRIRKEKFTSIVGLTYYDVKAQNFFFDEWTNTFLGLHLGGEYKIKKFHIGLHSYPAIRWFSSVNFNGLSGEEDFAYNIDINPSLAYAVNSKLTARISFSYGLNKALKPRGRDNEYQIHALRLGLQYELFGKKKTK